VFPFGPVVQMAYVVAPANLPADVRDRLTKAWRAAILDPRFKDFAEKNSFLVDDLNGEALTQEVGKVASALATVADKVFPKTQ
jgi:tripartite-type tricarboxylate transporter receptor subunit TctC